VNTLTLNSIQKAVLEVIQQDIPLVTFPFKQLAEACKCSEKNFIAEVQLLLQNNLIRDISAIINANKIGYKNTLIAVQSPENLVTETAQHINAHKGVSHNYLRNHNFNIWFTLSIPNNNDFEAELQKLFAFHPAIQYRILPAIHTFKLNVHFKLNGQPQSASDVSHKMNNDNLPVPLSDTDKQIIKILQQPYPIHPTPWNILATQLNISEKQLLDAISKYKQQGIIKRIAGVLRHHQVGITENIMLCFQVDENKIMSAGQQAASFNEVTHCYQRPTFPDWPYNLFCMIHASEQTHINNIIKKIASSIDCNTYLPIKSIKEFKKERVKYF